MQTLQNTGKRIEWIDAMRGFTMILVVFAHIESFGIFGLGGETVAGKLFQSFRMPLFFFVSGFIAYKADVLWTAATWWASTRKKLIVQLIPTVVIGLFYTCLYKGLAPVDFVTPVGKMGYWFTIVLLEIFLVVYTVNLCVRTTQPDKRKRHLMWVLVALSAFFYLLRFPLKIFPAANEAANILSLHYMCEYFQFFVFGYLMSMYRDFFVRMLANRYVTAAVIVCFVSLFSVKHLCLDAAPTASVGLLKIAATLAETVIAYMGVFTVFNFFRVYRDSFAATTKLGASLQYIGKRTLDIYLLHYFFLPSLPCVAAFLSQKENVVFELLLVLSCSLLVVGICLVVSNVLRTSGFLAQYLFGAKKQS